ncbi:MAG TPA: FliM/FliN family flagellar motor switch protein [Bryobacteraceae bacterium]|nr:FliM/FliN family flagellar motor switch protein [Bryobacteraceae bacterium]
MTPELPADSRAYDVCNPDRLPAERIAFVDGIHQQFLHAFAASLANYLDTAVAGATAGLDQLALKDFLDASAGDACLVTLNLKSTGGQAWVGLSSKLVFHILDILLGAPQPATPSERTTITEIETHVLREFFDALARTLVHAWGPSGISLEMGSITNADEVRQSADLEGTALVLHCSLRIQEQDETFRVAVPVLAVRLAAIEHEQKAAAEAAGESAARAARLETLGSAALELEAFLSGSAIRLGDLAAMQAGQVLVLTQPAGSQFECSVNGRIKFRGEWISLGDRHGLQVDSIVETEAGAKR